MHKQDCFHTGGNFFRHIGGETYFHTLPKKLNLQMMKRLLLDILPEVLNRNHHEAVRETRALQRAKSPPCSDGFNLNIPVLRSDLQ